jgi:hypothetical protein
MDRLGHLTDVSYSGATLVVHGVQTQTPFIAADELIEGGRGARAGGRVCGNISPRVKASLFYNLHH